MERELDLGNVGPLVLLTGYQTPAAIRRAGVKRLATWLRNRKVPGADQLAATAVQAAENQHTAVPGEEITAQVVHSLARQVMALNEKIAETDQFIEGRFRRHRHAEVIAGMPGIGPVLGAEFIAATGGDTDAFDNADHLAGFAGAAPAARDSGKISGNLHRPKRYSRRLQRVFCTSALISIRCCDESRRCYDRKRAEGKRHVQAVMALARRRVNVLWALLRDGRCHNPIPPVTQAA